MMKISFVVIFLFLTVFSFAQNGTPKSIWASKPVTVDGEAGDWKLPLKYYDERTKLFFAFANDDKNLYLCFQAPDKMFQAKIEGAGMEVSLSVKGKHTVSIIFPIAQQSASALPPTDGDGQQSADQKTRNISFVLQNNLMDVKGFSTRNGLIAINDSSGINAGLNFDKNNTLTYEITIPFKEWFGPNYTLNNIPKNVSLEVIINALKQSGHDKKESLAGLGKIGGGHHQRNADNPEEDQVMPGEYKYSLYTKVKMKQKFILVNSSNDN